MKYKIILITSIIFLLNINFVFANNNFNNKTLKEDVKNPLLIKNNKFDIFDEYGYYIRNNDLDMKAILIMDDESISKYDLPDVIDINDKKYKGINVDINNLNFNKEILNITKRGIKIIKDKDYSINKLNTDKTLNKSLIRFYKNGKLYKEVIPHLIYTKDNRTLIPQILINKPSTSGYKIYLRKINNIYSNNFYDDNINSGYIVEKDNFNNFKKQENLNSKEIEIDSKYFLIKIDSKDKYNILNIFEDLIFNLITKDINIATVEDLKIDSINKDLLKKVKVIFNLSDKDNIIDIINYNEIYTEDDLYVKRSIIFIDDDLNQYKITTYNNS